MIPYCDISQGVLTDLPSAISAIVGGVIAGTCSLLATRQMIRSERAKATESAKEIEFGLLQALHDELDVVWEQYTETMAPAIESLPDNGPLLNYYPIGQDYFPVYRGNTFLIGRIENNDLRRSLVSFYTKASGMIDSFRMNNELLGKYEFWTLQSQASSDEHAQRMSAAFHQSLVAYGRSIKRGHTDLKKECAALLRVLRKRGVITDDE